jgi:hypothetical protein
MTNGKGLFDDRVRAIIRSECSRIDLALRIVKAEDEINKIRADEPEPRACNGSDADLGCECGGTHGTGR